MTEFAPPDADQQVAQAGLNAEGIPMMPENLQAGRGYLITMPASVPDEMEEKLPTSDRILCKLGVITVLATEVTRIGMRIIDSETIKEIAFYETPSMFALLLLVATLPKKAINGS